MLAPVSSTRGAPCGPGRRACARGGNGGSGRMRTEPPFRVQTAGRSGVEEPMSGQSSVPSPCLPCCPAAPRAPAMAPCPLRASYDYDTGHSSVDGLARCQRACAWKANGARDGPIGDRGAALASRGMKPPRGFLGAGRCFGYDRGRRYFKYRPPLSTWRPSDPTCTAQISRIARESSFVVMLGRRRPRCSAGSGKRGQTLLCNCHARSILRRCLPR
jgi:hypothetical protein